MPAKARGGPLKAILLTESGGLRVGAMLLLWGVSGWPERDYGVYSGAAVLLVSLSGMVSSARRR
jgi:hypothetical protein